MKTLILWTLVLIIASVSNAQNVNIPDVSFKNILISKGIDTDGDSEISYAEAEAVSSLDVSFRGFKDITGIEAFINLNTLDCIGTYINSLDVSGNTALIYLNCSYSKLLTSLDVSSCTALERLDCYNNQLTSLDVSNNTDLTDLDCSNNQLTSLDVSENNDLTDLDCSNNQLTSLDVSNNTRLEYLDCSNNQLTSLNVSGCTALYYLDLCCMPTLHEVCVWTMPFPPKDEVRRIGAIDSPNVYFTTNCVVNIPGDYKENSAIDIYPNPSNDIINIKIENITNAILEIFNVSGTLVFSKELNSKVERIDISGLSEGIYFVKVRQKNNVRIEKLIVY